MQILRAYVLAALIGAALWALVVAAVLVVTQSL